MPSTNHSGSILSITEPQRDRQFAGREGGTVFAAPKHRLKERVRLIHVNLPITNKISEAKGNKRVGGMFLRCQDKMVNQHQGYENE
jgi:hypothetical protein